MSQGYVHGYSSSEGARLARQAGILAELIHDKARFAPGSRILEAGCGTGAQTVRLAANNPQATIVALDRSAISLEAARERLRAEAVENVELYEGDVNHLPFADGELDAAFLCFVLEHLSAPAAALREVRRVLRPGAVIQVFEGDHGSVLIWPRDAAIERLVRAASRYQSLQGGDPYIGRRLYPLLVEAGFQDVHVEPCVAYADETRPAWVDRFTRGTFITMMESLREPVLAKQLLTVAEWRAGMDALQRAAEEGGTFCYTFFRATACC